MDGKNKALVRLSLPAILGILLFALLLILPTLAGFYADHEARSSWEKRALAQWPKLPWDHEDENYFASLQSFIDDHIGFAVELNRFYRKLKFYIYRDNPIANIVVGNDRFVFLGSHNSTNPHAILEALCVEETRLERQASIKEGVGVLAWSAAILELRSSFAIFPSKPVLYPESLPLTVPSALREACRGFSLRENFPAQLAASRPQHIYYPLTEFQRLKDEPHFYPPGNFHAQGRSAHAFARGFLAMLGILVGEQYDRGAQVVTEGADLQAMGFIYQQPVWHYPYKDFGVIRANEQPELVLRYYPLATDFAHFTTASPASDRTALVLTNSFGAFVAPHLAPGFREIFQVNINDLDPIQTLPLMRAMQNQHAITDVIYLVHDTGFINGFKLTQLSQAMKNLVIEDLRP